MRFRERFTERELNELIDRIEDQPCPCAFCWRAAVRKEADRMRLRMSEETVNELADALAADMKWRKRTNRWWCGR